MDEREILRLLGDILKKLEKIGKKISADCWPEVNELFAAIRQSEQKLSAPDSGIPARLQANPAFAARYEELKARINDQIGAVTQTITTWKENQLKKIADSRNLSDALSRYYQTPDTSFFVDKKE